MNFLKYTIPLLLTTSIAVSPVMVSASDISMSEDESFSGASAEFCLATIESSIEETKDLNLMLNSDLMAMDAALAGGAVIAAVPTALAALPVGATLLVARQFGASTYKEVRLGNHGRVKQILLESVDYLQPEQHNDDMISEYPELQELVIRINGPLKTMIGRGYSAEQVAKIVIKAGQDRSFCGDASNYRMVHLKDYVLTNI